MFRKRDEADTKSEKRPPPSCAPEEFIHVFVRHSEWCVKFLEFLVGQDYNSKLLYAPVSVPPSVLCNEVHATLTVGVIGTTRYLSCI